MELYSQFFNQDLRESPYASGREAVEDILAMTDLYLNLVFYNRDAEQERLDMRGVVITPQEFKMALSDRILRVLNLEEPQARQYLLASAAQARAAADHMARRLAATKDRVGKEGGALPRALGLMECLSLNPLERFCFCLALACEYDRKYERIFGYAQDNIAARLPSLGLGISLYRRGLGPEGRSQELWIRQDSPLWLYLLKDARPAEGESGLSRPMALRETAVFLLKEEAPLPLGWEAFARPVGGTRLAVQLPALLEYCFGCRGGQAGEDSKGGVLLEDTIAGLALVSRLQGWELKLEGGGTDRPGGLRRLEMLAARYGIAMPSVNRLGACALPVPAVYGWEDLILEEFQKGLLRQISSRLKYRELVMDQWGFGEKSPYGNGISAIFYGSPGTGKTMAAQVIGRELGLEVYKVSLPRLVSKYVGETEKNLEELFQRAGEQQVVLFFDEADSLFAKRTAVSGANDRYANMETGYLLQRLEEFDGIVILATNLIHNIDEAFKRRIRFFVKFTLPDQAMRLKLWASMLPGQALVEEELLLPVYAARYELSGSEIRSCLTAAAYLAAACGRGIRNEDIQKALEIHYLKLGKKLGANDRVV